MRYMFYLVNIMVLLVSTPSWARKFENQYKFRVIKVEGDIAYLDSWTSNWFAAKPTIIIPPDSLVRLDPGSVLVVEISRNGATNTIDIASDEISFMRMTPDIVRKFSLKKANLNFLSSKLPSINGGKEPIKQPTPISQAWERVTSMSSLTMSMSEGILSNLKAEKKPNSISMSLFTPTVKITYPKISEVIFVSNFPVKIPISWMVENNSKSADKRVFLTYFWPAAEPRGEAQSQTAGYLSFVTAKKEGLYKIQVDDYDGEFKSEETTFYLKTY